MKFNNIETEKPYLKKINKKRVLGVTKFMQYEPTISRLMNVTKICELA